MPGCCVPGCKSNTTVPFHRFPKNANRRIEWLQRLQITQLEETIINKLHVCYKHFKEKDYSCCLNRKRLIDRAVPSIDITTCEDPVTTFQQQEGTREIPEPDTSQEAHICTDNAMLHEKSQPSVYKRPYLTEVTRKRKLSSTARKFYDSNIKLRKEIRRLQKVIVGQKKNKISTSITLNTGDKKGRQDGTASVREKFSVYERSSATKDKFMSKYLSYPSSKTLNTQLGQISLDTGYNRIIKQYLKSLSTEIDPKDRTCLLIWNEMSIQPSVQYHKKSDKIIGFEDWGNKRCRKFADHTIVFYIRCLSSGNHMPIGYVFCSATTTSIQLSSCIKEWLTLLIICGFNPVATVCDQGGNNIAAVNYLIAEARAMMLDSE